MVVLAEAWLSAGVGGEVHLGGFEKGVLVDLLQPLGGEVPDGSLLSTTFGKTKTLPARESLSDLGWATCWWRDLAPGGKILGEALGLEA